MSHHQSGPPNHQAPHGDPNAHYTNEINPHQVYPIQNPVNVNVPTTPTVIMPCTVQHHIHHTAHPHNVLQPQGQYGCSYSNTTVMMPVNIPFQPAGAYTAYYSPPIFNSPQSNPVKNVINQMPAVHPQPHFNQPGLVMQSPDIVRPPVNQMSTAPAQTKSRPNALTNIVDPKTGLNVAQSIYKHAKEENDSPPHPQDLQIAADFACAVAREAVPVPEPQTTSASASLPSRVQTRSSNDHQRTQTQNSQQSNLQYTAPSNSYQTTVTQSKSQSNSSRQRDNSRSNQHLSSKGNHQHTIPPNIINSNQPCDMYPQNYQQPIAESPQYQHTCGLMYSQMPLQANYSHISSNNYQQPVAPIGQYNTNVQISNQQSNFPCSSQQHPPVINYQQPAVVNSHQSFPGNDQVSNRNNRAYGISPSVHERVSAPSNQNVPEMYQQVSNQYELPGNNRDPAYNANNNQQYSLAVTSQHPTYSGSQYNLSAISQQQSVPASYNNPVLPQNYEQIALTSTHQYFSVANNQQTITTTSQIVVSHSNQQTVTTNSHVNVISHTHYQSTAPQNVSSHSRSDNLHPGDEKFLSSQSSSNKKRISSLITPKNSEQRVNYEPAPVQKNNKNYQQRSATLESNHQAPYNQINPQNTRQYHQSQNKRNYPTSTNNSNQRSYPGEAYGCEKPPAVPSSRSVTTILRHPVVSEAEFKSHGSEQDNARSQSIHMNPSVSFPPRSFNQHMRMPQYPQNRQPRSQHQRNQSYQRFSQPRNLPPYNSAPRGAHSWNSEASHQKSFNNLNISTFEPNNFHDGPPNQRNSSEEFPRRRILERSNQDSRRQSGRVRQQSPSNFPGDSGVQRTLENSVPDSSENMSTQDANQRRSPSFKLLRSTSSDLHVAENDSTSIESTNKSTQNLGNRRVEQRSRQNSPASLSGEVGNSSERSKKDFSHLQDEQKSKSFERLSPASSSSDLSYPEERQRKRFKRNAEGNLIVGSNEPLTKEVDQSTDQNKNLSSDSTSGDKGGIQQLPKTVSKSYENIPKHTEYRADINASDAPQAGNSSRTPSITRDVIDSKEPIPDISTNKDDPIETKKDLKTGEESADSSAKPENPESNSKLSYSSVLLKGGGKPAPVPVFNDLKNKKVPTKGIVATVEVPKPLSTSNSSQQPPENPEEKFRKRSRSKNRKKGRNKQDDRDFQNSKEKPSSNNTKKTRPLSSNEVQASESKQSEVGKKSSNFSRETRPVPSNKLPEPVVAAKQLKPDRKPSPSPNVSKETRPVTANKLSEQVVESKPLKSDRKPSPSPSVSEETQPAPQSELPKQVLESKKSKLDKKQSPSPSISTEAPPVSSNKLPEKIAESKQLKADEKSSNVSKESHPVAVNEPPEQVVESKQSKSKIHTVLLSKLQEKVGDSKPSESNKKASPSKNTSKKGRAAHAAEQKKVEEPKKPKVDIVPVSLLRNSLAKIQVDPLSIVHKHILSVKNLEESKKPAAAVAAAPPEKIPIKNHREIPVGELVEIFDNSEMQASGFTKKELLEMYLEDPSGDAHEPILVRDQKVLVDEDKKIVIDDIYDIYSREGVSEAITPTLQNPELNDPRLVESFLLESFTFLNPSQIDSNDNNPSTSAIIKETADVVTEVAAPKIPADERKSVSFEQHSEAFMVIPEITPDDKAAKTEDDDDDSEKTDDAEETLDIEKLVSQKNEKNLQCNDLECNPETPIHIIPRINLEDKTDSKVEEIEGNTEKNYAQLPEEATSGPAEFFPERREYGREFLIRLKDSPFSQNMPLNLPDMDIIEYKPKRKTQDYTPVNLRSFPEQPSRTPEYFFANSSSANRSFSSRVALPSRKSSSASKSKPPEPQIIHVKLSRNEDVALRTSENAWKPNLLKKVAPENDEEKTQSLYKKVRSVLNKLTPEKFDKLIGQVRELEIDTQQRLQGVIDLVFDKAIAEPSFAVAYALMCSELSLMKVSNVVYETPPQDLEVEKNDVNFRKLLLTRCQYEFVQTANDEALKEVKLEEIQRCTDSSKRKELQLSLEEYDYRIRKRSVGIVKFIGELFKLKMLTRKIMRECIEDLLRTPDEERLECLCKLLTTIGRLFEDSESLANYMDQLKRLTAQKKKVKISSRIRFMIQDVIDLRLNKWVPRRNDANPKTMDQIKKDVEKERENTNVLLSTPQEINRRSDRNTPYNSYRQQDDRVTPQNNTHRNDRFTPQDRYNQREYSDSRRHGSRHNSKPDNEGWSPSKSRNRPSLSVQTNKLTIKPPDDNNVFGDRKTYMWKSTTPSSLTPTSVYNSFSLLDTPSVPDRDRLSVNISGSRSAGPKEYRSNSRGGRHYHSSYHSSNGGSTRRESLSASRMISPSVQNHKNTFEPTFKVPNSRAAPISLSRTSSNSSISSNPALISRSNSSSSIANNRPQKSAEELLKVFKELVDNCGNPTSMKTFVNDIQEILEESFDSFSFSLFFQETIGIVFERPVSVRQRYSFLIAHMIEKNFVCLPSFQTEYQKILETVDDLVIDFPHCWTYLAEVLSEMLISGVHPFAELKETLSTLRNTGNCGKLLGGLLAILENSKGSDWLMDKWSRSELFWSDFLDIDQEPIEEIIKKCKLNFFNINNNNIEMAPMQEINFNDIQNNLVKLIREENFDNTVAWISTHIGDETQLPQFARNLVTSIIKVSIEKHDGSWKLNEETFIKLLQFIRRYVDADPQLELQCLYAIQAYLNELQHPQGVLARIIDILYSHSVIADETFFEWQKSKDPAEVQGHAVAISALGSFFRNLSLPQTNDESGDET